MSLAGSLPPGTLKAQTRRVSTKAIDASTDSEYIPPKLPRQPSEVSQTLRGLLASLTTSDQRESPSKTSDHTQATGATAEAEAEQEFWTYESHGKLVGKTPKLLLCDTLASADAATAKLLQEPVVGLDLEWVSNTRADMDPKRRVSLLQLAGADLIVLVQIARFPGDEPKDLMPPNLKALLESKTIKKAGVNVRGDCNRIRESFGVGTEAIYELSHMHKLVKYAGGDAASQKLINKRLVSLTAQCEEHLGLPLKKELFVRASDWTQELSAEQRLYAGSDAYVGYVLFQTLDAKRRKMEPVPALPAPLEFFAPLGSGKVANAKSAGTARTPGGTKSRAATKAAGTAAEEEEYEGGDNYGGAEEEQPRALDKAAAASETKSAADVARLAAATAFAHSTRSSIVAVRGADAPKPGPAQLRAYYLWYTCGMEVQQTALLLGIKPGSVAGYVLDAVMVGRLDHDPGRIVVAAQLVPAKVLRARYLGFLKRVAEQIERDGRRA